MVRIIVLRMRKEMEEEDDCERPVSLVKDEVGDVEEVIVAERIPVASKVRDEGLVKGEEDVCVSRLNEAYCVRT